MNSDEHEIRLSDPAGQGPTAPADDARRSHRALRRRRIVQSGTAMAALALVGGAPR